MTSERKRATELGYTEGQQFTIVNDESGHGWPIGGRVTLIYDDGSVCPEFEGDNGRPRYIYLDDVEPATADMVNHPPHYKALGFEVIDITEKLNFCLGNAVKYILRADFKHDDNGIEDLDKARWYVEREIERRKREEAA